MKRKTHSIYITVSIILTAIFTSCSSPTDRDLWQLKGEVKALKEKNYRTELVAGEWMKRNGEMYGGYSVDFEKSGNYIEMRQYGYRGEFIQKLVPTREDGLVVDESYYDENNVLQTKIKINHLSKNELEYESYNANNTLVNKGKTQKKNNKIIKQLMDVYEGGEKVNELTTTYEYDDKGDIISLKQTDKNGEAKLFQKFKHLEYDEKGNWTKKLVYKGESDEEESVELIVIRDIEYY